MWGYQPNGGNRGGQRVAGEEKRRRQQGGAENECNTSEVRPERRGREGIMAGGRK